MKLVKMFWFSLFLTVVIISCDAPHSNPLESYVIIPDTVEVHDTTTVRDTTTIRDTTIVPPDVYAVKGYIRSMHSTPLPLKNVLVSWNKTNSIKTNSEGFFQIANIEKENGWLYFSLDTYIEDSLRVTWENQILPRLIFK